MKNTKSVQSQARRTLDEEELIWRNDVVEEAFRLYAERALFPDQRCADLIEAYRSGEIEIEELRLEILRPFLV